MVFDYDTNAVPLPCPIGALEATPVLEGPDGPIWIPALDVHRFGGMYAFPERAELPVSRHLCAR